MIRFSALVVTGTLLASQALAGDAVLSPRRQVVNCMVKQMSISKTLSYNDAAKLCKDQVRSRSDTLASMGKPAGVRDYRGSPQNQ